MEFWLRQEVFTIQNGFHGTQLLATRGMTEGRLDSPTLFNVAVESVVRHWMSLTVEEESTTHEGLWMAIGRFM